MVSYSCSNLKMPAASSTSRQNRIFLGTRWDIFLPVAAEMNAVFVATERVETCPLVRMSLGQINILVGRMRHFID